MFVTMFPFFPLNTWFFCSKITGLYVFFLSLSLFSSTCRTFVCFSFRLKNTLKKLFHHLIFWKQMNFDNVRKNKSHVSSKQLSPNSSAQFSTKVVFTFQFSVVWNSTSGATPLSAILWFFFSLGTKHTEPKLICGGLSHLITCALILGLLTLSFVFSSVLSRSLFSNKA